MIYKKKGILFLRVLFVAAMLVHTLVGSAIPHVHADSPLDRNNLNDGTYKIDVALWHVVNDAPSMAAPILADTAKIEVEDGLYKMILQINQGATIMGVAANVQHLEIRDHASHVVPSTVVKTNENGEPKIITFVLAEVADFVPVRIEAMDGMMNQQARINLNWDSLAIVELTEPPVIEPPVTEPPVTEPPVIEPPVTPPSVETAPPVLDPANLQDGTYEVNVALWHATNDAPSMAAPTLGETAEIFVINGVVTMRIFPNQGALVFPPFPGAPGIPAFFTTLEVSGASVMIDALDSNGNPVSFSFIMPHTDQFISVIAQGSNARLNINWDSLAIVELTEPPVTEPPVIEPPVTEPPGTPPPGTEPPALDPAHLANGTYRIEIALWHATNDAPSMAADVLTGKADIIVVDGVYTMVVHTQATNIMGMPATMEALKVFDLNGNPVEVQIVTAMSAETSFLFVMPHTEQFIGVQVSAMNGAMVQPARLYLNWSSLELVSLAIPEIPGRPVCPGPPGTNGSGSNNNNDGSSVLDPNNLEDGIYEVSVALWNATSDQPSMANGSFVGTARIRVEEGVSTMFVYTQPMRMGTITASLQSMQIERASGGMGHATIETRANNNPTSFSFLLPHTNQFIASRVNPEVAIMGNTYIDARINVSWNTLTQVSSNTDLTVAPIGGSNTASANPGASVPTGDTANTAFYQVMLLTSGLAIGVYVVNNKAKKVCA